MNRVKIRNFHSSLASLFTGLFKVIAKYFKVLRTCRGGVAMTTIHVVMFDIIVWEYPTCGIHMFMCRHAKIVNVRCHLEIFQALSTNFGDNPRSVTVQSSRFFLWCTSGTVDETVYFYVQTRKVLSISDVTLKHFRHCLRTSGTTLVVSWFRAQGSKFFYGVLQGQ